MKISSKELINKFYEEVAKNKYPQYNREQITIACYTPFRYLRKAIKSCHMPSIRFKYLGEFKPNVFKVCHFLRKYSVKHIYSDFQEVWITMMMNDCQRLINREICELEERFVNE